MTFETLTPNGANITAPDMRGVMSDEFVPFAVRGPNFIELNSGEILYFFGMKFGSQLDEALGCMAMMRSTDGGKNWGDMTLLRYDGAPFDVNGGTPVYDAVNDTLVLLSRTRHWKPGFEEDRLLAEGDQIKGHTYERFWVSKSSDGGRTWSDYKETIIEGTPQNWTIQHNLTPGIGIQLKNQSDPKKNGRLIMPTNRAELNCGENEFRAHILYSDDGGDTWQIGALEDYLGANESVACELTDGTVVFNCRNQGGKPENRRIQAYSRDGGESFEPGDGVVDSLFDPICHAGFTHTVYKGEDIIFFTAPTGELGDVFKAFGTPQRWGSREALGLYVSRDGGKTYALLKKLSDSGVFAAYSALLVTREGKLLAAWESGPEIGLYRDIRYTILDVAELLDGDNGSGGGETVAVVPHADAPIAEASDSVAEATPASDKKKEKKKNSKVRRVIMTVLRVLAVTASVLIALLASAVIFVCVTLSTLGQQLSYEAVEDVIDETDFYGIVSTVGIDNIIGFVCDKMGIDSFGTTEEFDKNLEAYLNSAEFKRSITTLLSKLIKTLESGALNLSFGTRELMDVIEILGDPIEKYFGYRLSASDLKLIETVVKALGFTGLAFAIPLGEAAAEMAIIKFILSDVVVITLYVLTAILFGLILLLNIKHLRTSTLIIGVTLIISGLTTAFSAVIWSLTLYIVRAHWFIPGTLCLAFTNAPRNELARESLFLSLLGILLIALPYLISLIRRSVSGRRALEG